MAEPLFAIYGTGGCARDILPYAAAQLDRDGHRPEQLVLVDDAARGGETIGRFAVVTYDELLARKSAAGEARLAVAISDSKVRQALDEKAVDDGFAPWTIIAPNSLVMDRVEVGSGSIISAFVSLTCDLSVGRSFHANNHCNIAHDCRIGDYVTFAPGVMCNGNVHIGDHAYIGAGAVLRHGQPDRPLTIGAHAVIGMGAVVTKDVPAHTTVIGNPARPIER